MTKLAILGGKAIRNRPFPDWPIFGKEEESALLSVFRSGKWGIGGTQVKDFQEKFAESHNAKYAVAVMNGTVSLEIALKAVRVGFGDEVIVPAYTFAATATAVLNVNAIPVFVDIDPDTYCLDPKAIIAAITPQTKAIIPVHIGGHPADMDAIMAIAEQHGLFVIEDAAQAHFAEWRGKKVGNFGHLASFSFQNTKNMSAGEGGIILTNDQELADRCWSYHNCGRTVNGAWYHHPFFGGNYRMTQLQASVLIHQIPRAIEQTRIRERNAILLNKYLSQIRGITPMQKDPRVTMHAYHLYMVKYHQNELCGLERSAFISALVAEGIPASRGYVPLHKEGFIEEAKEFYLRNSDFARRDYSQCSLPETEKACDETIWLPQTVLLGSTEEIKDIADAFEKVVKHSNQLAKIQFDKKLKETGVIFGKK